MALQAQKPRSRAYPAQLRSIGDHIRKRRLDLGLFQEQAAKRLQTSLCNLRNWEKNRSTPHIRYLPGVVKFIGYVPWQTSCLTLGQRIKNHRKLRGLSQKELAQKAGLSPADAIRSWENGHSKPDRQLLRALAAFFVHGRKLRTLRRARGSGRPLLARYPRQAHTLADRLRKRRLELGLTHKELADTWDKR